MDTENVITTAENSATTEATSFMPSGIESESQINIPYDISQIVARFSEEVADTENYFRFAQNFYNANDKQMAKYIMLIAKDEYSHADFIMKIANHYNIPLPAHEIEHLAEVHHHMQLFLE